MKDLKINMFNSQSFFLYYNNNAIVLAYFNVHI